MNGVVHACIQAVLVAVLLWVGNKTAETAEKVAALSAQVVALEWQIKRVETRQDQNAARR